MKAIIHKANSRGHMQHGWLNTYHSFSFANYYDPERMGFGALRVLNDDTIAAGKGFGMHPHDNMEIFTIPLKGDLKHQDSMGNSSIIKSGEVQVMSAGSGIRHSEFNPDKDKSVSLLQIWIYPNKQDATPRYDQIVLDHAGMKNKLLQILSPDPDDEGVWIHQNAWFHLGNLYQNSKHTYKLKTPSNGVYAFVIEGKLQINGQKLSKRDGMGITETASFEIDLLEDTTLLLIEVPV